MVVVWRALTYKEWKYLYNGGKSLVCEPRVSAPPKKEKQVYECTAKTD